mgnify:CR=1 FL=1
MAVTNFAALSANEILLWKRQTWRQARNQMFTTNFVGGDSNAMIQRVTDLRPTTKGTQCVITLVSDLIGDGVAGDRNLEGNEEAMKSYEDIIRYDMLRHAVTHEGRMADMKSIVNFRENARNNVAYWLADRIDQMAFLTLSGVSYALTPNGALRTGSDLPYLEFASDVSAPTTNRHYRWDATNGLVTADTTAVATADLPTWEMLIEAKALAREKYIKPIRMNGGVDVYHVFMTPRGIAKLKQDDAFLAAWQNARERSANNPLFKGTAHMNGIMVDGLMIHDFRYVYNTLGATAGTSGEAGDAGYKWGADADVDGQRILFCGAQALAMADIGLPLWVEKEFDYDNRPGISIGKMFGFLKPKFYSIYEQATEDFGVLCIDTAI